MEDPDYVPPGAFWLVDEWRLSSTTQVFFHAPRVVTFPKIFKPHSIFLKFLNSNHSEAVVPSYVIVMDQIGLGTSKAYYVAPLPSVDLYHRSNPLRTRRPIRALAHSGDSLGGQGRVKPSLSSQKLLWDVWPTKSIWRTHNPSWLSKVVCPISAAQYAPRVGPCRSRMSVLTVMVIELLAP